MDIVMIPSPYEDSRTLEFNWECKNFTTKYIDLQIDFKIKSEVSIYEIRDSIKVIFFGKNYFVSFEG